MLFRSAWTATETYTGFVRSVNDLYVTLTPVDFMGERCQDITFRIADLELVAFGSEEEILYEQLDDYHHRGQH